MLVGTGWEEKLGVLFAVASSQFQPVCLVAVCEGGPGVC